MQILNLIRNQKATTMVALSLMGASVWCAVEAPGVGAEPLKEASQQNTTSGKASQSKPQTVVLRAQTPQVHIASKQGIAISPAQHTRGSKNARQSAPLSGGQGTGSASALLSNSSTAESSSKTSAANTDVLSGDSATDGKTADNAAAASGTTNGAGDASATKILLKPGQPISLNMETEDIQPTDDPVLARQQAAAYPDSPEAAFILAVALTRTSQVEEALKEVRHARRLAQAKGGADYFDKMISSYEKMLEYCPDDNRVRYGLAWAYYMKAYLLSQNSKKAAAANFTDRPAEQASAANVDKSLKNKNVNANVASEVLSMINPKLSQNLPTDGKVSNKVLPHIPSALEGTPPSAVPQVKQYYEAALKNLDDLLARKPDDVWARVYRAHLAAEYSGDLPASMATWRDCQQKYPQNPASYFFLGEGYLKQGNLKECLSNITRAIALRALGN